VEPQALVHSLLLVMAVLAAADMVPIQEVLVIPLPLHFQIHQVTSTMLRMVSLILVVVVVEELLLLQALTPQVAVDLVSS